MMGDSLNVIFAMQARANVNDDMNNHSRDLMKHTSSTHTFYRTCKQRSMPIT